MARAHRQGSLNQAEMGESQLLGIDQCTTHCNFASFKPVRSIGASLVNGPLTHLVVGNSRVESGGCK
jgi:hypothetical protein